MNVQAKKRAVTRRASYDCTSITVKREGLTAKRLYHIIPVAVKSLFIILVSIYLVLSFINVYKARNPKLEVIEHKVSYGETLWSIAKEYKPEGMSMGAYMDWVYSNNEAGVIYPGDVVFIGVKV